MRRFPWPTAVSSPPSHRLRAPVERRPRRKRSAILLATALAACTAAAQAQPTPLPDPTRLETIPAPLADWLPWVLAGRDGERCPLFQGDANAAGGRCVWPGALALAADDDGAVFEQAVTALLAGSFPLPGDNEAWPEEVTVDGRPAAVVSPGGRPAVTLAAGRHVVRGTFRWPNLPESLAVPADTGLVQLRLRGAPVDFPERDADGRLGLARRGAAASAATEEDRLEVAIYRRLIDDVPLQVVTRIELTVAGKAREGRLPGALPSGAVPSDLASPLPARLERDGTLVLQLRPGSWRIELQGRFADRIDTLGPAAELGSGVLPGEELWVFEARPNLRVVDLAGVAAIDPTQTTLPSDWRDWPAYRLGPGEHLQLRERQRGAEQSQPDRVTLARRLWLDGVGDAFTVQDHLQGDLRRAWRLELGAPGELGRASVAGVDQVLTRRGEAAPGGSAAGASPIGIEVRQGRLDLVAESRLPRPGWFAALPAVGWQIGGTAPVGPPDGDRDPAGSPREGDGAGTTIPAPAVQGLATSVDLPPGWRLFTVFGADRSSGTWTARWTLLDLFLVLVVGFAGQKLWGLGGGGLAIAAAVLAYHEPDAPRWLWLAALAGAAAWRELGGGGWLRGLLRGLGAIAVAAFVLVCLPFAVQQIRQAQNPVLERANLPFGEALDGGFAPSGIDAVGYLGGDRNETDAMEVAAQVPMSPEPLAEESASYDRLRKSVESKLESRSAPRRQATIDVDPDAQVSTGPGLPAWSWRRHELAWSGPVDANQTIRLVLLSPAITSLLAVLRVVLLALVVLRLVAMLRRRGDAGEVEPNRMDVPPGRDAGGEQPAAASDEGGAPATTLARTGGLAQPATSTLVALALSLAGSLLATSPAAAQMPSPELLEELRTRLLARPACHPDCASASRLLIDAGERTLRLRLEVGAATATAIPLPGAAGQWQASSVLLDGAPPRGLVRGDNGTVWILVDPGGHEIELAGPLPEREQVTIPLPLRPHRARATITGWTIDGLYEDGRVDDALRLTRLRPAERPGNARDESGREENALDATALPPFLRVERTVMLGLRWRVETTVRRLSPTGVPATAEVPLLPGESVASAGVRTANGLVQVSLAAQAVESRWSSVLEVTDQLVLRASEAAGWTESWRLEASPIWHVTASGLPAVHDPDSSEVRIPQWRPWPGESLTLVIERPAGVPGQAMTIDRSRLSLTPGPRFADATLDVELRASRGGTHHVTLPAGAELESLTIDGVEQPAHATTSGAPADAARPTVAVPIRPGAQALRLTWREPRGQALLLRSSAVDLGLPSVNHELTINPGNRWLLAMGGDMARPSVLFWGVMLVLAAVAWGLGRLATTPLGAVDWFLLGIGLSQIPLVAGAVVAAWLLALGWRREHLPRLPGWKRYDAAQLLLLGLTPIALGLLVWGLQQGLLGTPDMQISGNDSSATSLRWFADRIDQAVGSVPSAWVISLPIFVYRLAMLAWALWLASRVLGWLRWGFNAWSAGGLWRPWPRWRRAERPQS